MLYEKTMPDGSVLTQEASNEGHIHILLREGFTPVAEEKNAMKKNQKAASTTAEE